MGPAIGVDAAYFAVLVQNGDPAGREQIFMQDAVSQDGVVRPADSGPCFQRLLRGRLVADLAIFGRQGAAGVAADAALAGSPLTQTPDQSGQSLDGCPGIARRRGRADACADMLAMAARTVNSRQCPWA